MATVTIPISLEQLLEAMRQLDEASRIEVARTLRMDISLAHLIEQLAANSPVPTSDAKVKTEIKAVRRAPIFPR